MKDGNSTVLYTKETRVVCNLLCVHRAYRAAEQQSNRALCRSRDTTLCCLGSRSRRTLSLSDPLPEASLHYPPPGLAQSLELDKRVSCPRLLPSSWFRKMPAVRTSSTSTTRRLDLANFIDVFGDTMVQKCSNCAKHNRLCKVHLRSGKCNHCNRKNIGCDVKVTQSEFRRLTEEKQKLRRQIDEALSAQAEALEMLRTARAREERLRKQMDLTDQRAAEAIAVEARALEELDTVEGQETLVPDTSAEGLALQLSPST